MSADDAGTLSRRALFQLGLGAATLAACSSRSSREILPYAEQPELTPGVPRHYATALVEDGFAIGVLVATHEGRPTKIEGNPDHPASLGGTRAIEQAAVLSLFDPGRLRAVTVDGAPAELPVVRAAAGVTVVMEPTSSPELLGLIERVRARGARVVSWSPFGVRAQLDGHRQVFGRAVQRQLRLADADVVVTLDADLVADHPMAPAYARQISDRRRVASRGSAMSRLYAIESSYTPMGVIADHRWAVRPSELAAIASELYAAVTRGSARGWVSTIAADLVAQGGRAVVVAGERQPAAVHAVVAAINAVIESRVVGYSEPVVMASSLAELRAALAGAHTVLVLGGDPADAVPGFADAMMRCASVYVGLHANATARACKAQVPGLHDLEQWGWARAYDGTLTPQQPLIEPLFGGHSVAEMLRRMLGEPPLTGRPAEMTDDALIRGVAGEAAPLVAVTARWQPAAPAAMAALELELRPHPFLHDGRYRHNPWLRELPEPTTKLTWGNAAQLSPATAEALGLATGEVVQLAAGGRAIEAAVIVVPGHADGALALHAGDPDSNAFALWDGEHCQLPVVVVPLHRSRALAITQAEMSQHGRPIALAAELATLDAEAFAAHRGAQPTLYASRTGGGPQWAMSIDLTTCTGCSACVMACAAENNTPVVGAARIREHREMHWLRIDRYVDGGVARVQPMTCQHCEHAPCEYVCPTAATSHSPDGINEMTYNRCVGTRFCANNCPYKVRRFNWFDLKDRKSLRVLGKNPDVTVRDRGVMEKCTYCVQRVRRAEIDARVAGAPIGAVVTACQQACPTGAIAFGSLTDAASTVSEHRRRPHSYAVLHDQGTRPRTQYLAQVKNRNGALP